MIGALPTGSQKLEILIQALQRSDLTILIIPPSIGQVSLIHSLALSVTTSSPQSVALFSPAVNKYRLVQRLLAMSAGIDAHCLQTGQLSDEERRHVSATASMLSRAKLWIDDTFDLSIEVLRQRVTQLAKRHDVGLVIVDHMYLLRLSANDKRGTDQWQVVFEVSRSLKALAHDLKIPIVAVAPLSHALENRQRMLLQHSDKLDGPPKAGTEHFLFLHHYESSPVESTSNHLTIATLLITKERDGLVTELEIFTPANRSG